MSACDSSYQPQQKNSKKNHLCEGCEVRSHQDAVLVCLYFPKIIRKSFFSLVQTAPYAKWKLKVNIVLADMRV